jgi:hypothetical protein
MCASTASDLMTSGRWWRHRQNAQRSLPWALRGFDSATITVDEMDSQTKELSEFCGVLWREREVVERVLFKVLGQQLVLKSGQLRWLVAANNEIELAVNDLRVIEVMRCAEADRLADHLGTTNGATLAQLAAIAPEPWGSILAEHRDALRDLAAEIDTAVRENRTLLVDGATTLSRVSP